MAKASQAQENRKPYRYYDYQFLVTNYERIEQLKQEKNDEHVPLKFLSMA